MFIGYIRLFNSKDGHTTFDPTQSILDMIFFERIKRNDIRYNVINVVGYNLLV